jgi:hypothetical protein
MPRAIWERTNETGFVEIDRPQILDTAIGLLKSELGYSVKRLAETTCLFVSDYLRLFETNFDQVKGVKLKGALSP